MFYNGCFIDISSDSKNCTILLISDQIGFFLTYKNFENCPLKKPRIVCVQFSIYIWKWNFWNIFETIYNFLVHSVYDFKYKMRKQIIRIQLVSLDIGYL